MGRVNTTSTIIIADENALFRRGLRTLLSTQEGFQVVEEASAIEEALQKVQSLVPTVFIMNLAMLKTEFQDATVAVRQTQPATALLCLTGQDGEQQLETAVGAGARGYMRRDTAAAQIVSAVGKVVGEDGESNPYGLSRIVPDLQALAKTNRLYDRKPSLTAREQEVVRLLADGKTVKQTASELSLSMKTVEAHKLNLMRKLDIHNRASLVEYAVYSGLVNI